MTRVVREPLSSSASSKSPSRVRRWRARTSAGIKSSTSSRPSASPRSHPNVVSAATFIAMILCSWSTVTIGSTTASTIAAFSSSSVKG